MIPQSTGIITTKRYNETTQSGTPAIILNGVRANLQDPSDDDTLAFAASGGLQELQDDLKARPIKKLFIGGWDENPIPANWRLLKNDIVSYVADDGPSPDDGDYLVVTRPVTKGGLPGRQFVRAMVAFVG